MRALFRGKKTKTPTPQTVVASPKPQEPPLEDVLKQLDNYEVVILMDDSGSMASDGYWKDAENAMIGVVETAAEYDKNGIDIRFLNHTKEANITTKEQVKQLFKEVQPSGLTPLGVRLGNVCSPWLRKYENADPGNPQKRLLVIAITDGAPSNEREVYDTIRSIANRLDAMNAPRVQLGIQFVQIGRDRAAKKFLEDLDNNLKGEGENKVSRDIVDTVPYRGGKLTSEQLVKILAGAINKKID